MGKWGCLQLHKTIYIKHIHKYKYIYIYMYIHMYYSDVASICVFMDIYG